MTIILLLVLCLIASVLTWQSSRGLATIKREVERHEQGRAFRARVLAELASKAVQS
jgi:hypothetical protein